jgi:hypothetical protein
MADLTMTITVDDVVFEATTDDGFQWLGEQRVRKTFEEVKAFKQAAENAGLTVAKSDL